MNTTEAVDLHGLTPNQYTYLEALLANITTSSWISESGMAYLPNVGSPTGDMGLISKPLNEVNLLKLLASETPITWGITEYGTYLQQQGHDVRYAIQISARHVRKTDRLITNARHCKVQLGNGRPLSGYLCVPSYMELLKKEYGETLFWKAYSTISLMYMSHIYSGGQPTFSDIPTLDDVLTMLEGYGNYHTITYAGNPVTVPNTKTSKRYSGESGVELAYDNTSSEGKYSLRYIAGVTCYYFSVLATLFFLASFVAVFFMRGYMWLLTGGFGMLSFIFIYSTATLLTEEEIKKL